MAFNKLELREELLAKRFVQVASVSINNVKGTFTIIFPGGYRLEHSSARGSAAKWTEALKTSPYTVQAGTAVDFFRAVSP